MRRCELLLFLLFSPFLLNAQTDNVGSGRAILFDGINDYLEMGNIYDDVSLPVTISLWIYIRPGTPAGNMAILDSQDGSTTYNGFGMLVSQTPHVGVTYGDGTGGNNPAFRASKAAIMNSITGRWIHIAGVIRGHGNMDIYFNGKNAGGNYEGFSTLPMNSNSPSETMHVGVFNSNGFIQFFNGMMDELRIWDRALTETEIRRDMCQKLTGTEAGLIGYWNFDETSGNIVKDKSKNHFDGQLIGNPQRVYSGAPIGDESVYMYPSNWNGVSLSLDGLTAENITGTPYGIHLYKVNNDPSQQGGLPSDAGKNPYYGIFLAEDPGGKRFDFSFDSSCKFYVREDNSVSNWTESLSQTNIVSRIEIVPLIDVTDFQVTLGDDRILCDQPATTITAVLANPAGKTFRWNTGQTSQSITVNQSGEYSVTVTAGCKFDRDTIMITLGHTPPEFSLGDDEMFCGQIQKILSPDIRVDPSYEYTWHNGSTDTTQYISAPGLYWLTIKNSCGTSADSIRITKREYSPDTFPNLITPNDDTFNQYFEIGEELIGSHLYIVNRWGKKVYESVSYQNNWSGEKLAAGIYYYYIVTPCLEKFKGSIHVLR